ncbi:MAG: TetR/AcrR family transcriptional regulator [Treponema sp.]|jgi:AcrR family transcriptional regulator|nr:TetR/AcrR family transcriptional regulator [Treponema sp.]
MNKTKIIDAAFRVWGRNFYRKTSLSQLAGELGVSKPALYRHFKSKQALTEAMTEQFLDDFAASIRDDFEKALDENDPDKGISTIIRGICGFFAQNVYALLFFLINIYDHKLDGFSLAQQLKSRGVDMAVIQTIIEKKYIGDPKVIRLVFATLSFLMANFHKKNKSMLNPPNDEQIKKIIDSICLIIEHGIGYSINEVAVDFEKLEKQVEEMALNSESEPFFKAVAEAVAQAGPWDVSMEMVAQKLGLSKSSLYGRFKNRKDMLRRLFVTEFKHIIEYARQGIGKSTNAAQQLYLGIFSVATYLRSRPEILVAMSWIRTRKLDLGKPGKDIEIFRLFEDIDIEPVREATDEDRQRISHWILFLLINILTSNDNIRLLYKFVTLGLGGFKK